MSAIEHERPGPRYHFPNPEQPPRDKAADDRIKAALLTNKIAEVVALGEGLPETFFDYGEVQAENRAELQTLTRDIKRAFGRHLEAIVEIGEGLLKAKELLGHGNFLPWLAAEFRWSERTAQSYMTLAEHFQGKTAKFADLDLGAARALIKARSKRGPKIAPRDLVTAAAQAFARNEIDRAELMRRTPSLSR
jgi:Protein of unknown function (DUF3102)